MKNALDYYRSDTLSEETRRKIIENLMDKEICEELHGTLDDQSFEAFLVAYIEKHAAKYDGDERKEGQK